MTLDLMEIGDKKKIVSIDNDLSIKKRLLEIGISNGEKIECILRNPFKNMCAYLVKDTLVAIRKDDAKRINVCDIYE